MPNCYRYNRHSNGRHRRQLGICSFRFGSFRYSFVSDFNSVGLPEVQLADTLYALDNEVEDEDEEDEIEEDIIPDELEEGDM